MRTTARELSEQELEVREAKWRLRRTLYVHLETEMENSLADYTKDGIFTAQDFCEDVEEILEELQNEEDEDDG